MGERDCTFIIREGKVRKKINREIKKTAGIIGYSSMTAFCLLLNRREKYWRKFQLYKREEHFKILNYHGLEQEKKYHKVLFIILINSLKFFFTTYPIKISL